MKETPLLKSAKITTLLPPSGLYKTEVFFLQIVLQSVFPQLAIDYGDDLSTCCFIFVLVIMWQII